MVSRSRVQSSWSDSPQTGRRRAGRERERERERPTEVLREECRHQGVCPVSWQQLHVFRPTLLRRFSLFGCKQQQPLGELTVNMVVTAESSWSCCTSFTDGSSMWATPPPVQQVERVLPRLPPLHFHRPNAAERPSWMQTVIQVSVRLPHVSSSTSPQRGISVHSSLSAPLSSPQTSSDVDFLLSSSFTMLFSTL